MRLPALTLTILLGIFCGSCSDEPKLSSPDTEEEPWSYPVTLVPLDETVLEERLARFHEENPGVCASIDPFGRLAHHGTCRPPEGAGVADSASAVAIAVSFLKRNREFFWLADDFPPVSRATRLADRHWEVEFAPQVVHYMEVNSTRIELRLAGSVYRAEGGHYPEYRVPQRLVLTADEARICIPGAIQFQCFTRIDAYLGDEAVLVAFPRLQSGDPIRGGSPSLELRIAYRFSYEDDRGAVLRYVFVDALTGEKLASRNVIVC